MENEELRGGELVSVVAKGAFHTLACVRKGDSLYGLRRLTSRGRDEARAHERMRTESRVLTMLAGRGAPRLVSHGEDAHGPFVMYAWASGTPASESRTSSLSFATRAFAALAEVHGATDAASAEARFVVHGDLRPENVVLREAGAVLVDFGLARVVGEGAPREPAFAGTAQYVAPEVARGEAASLEPREAQSADVFALAMCTLHVDRAAPPRRGTSLPALLLEAGAEPPALPDATSPAHAALLAVLGACLDAAPARRPTAREVAKSLAALR